MLSSAMEEAQSHSHGELLTSAVSDFNRRGDTSFRSACTAGILRDVDHTQLQQSGCLAD